MLHKIFDPWIRVSIAASISWPLSYLITSILASPLSELESPIPLLVLVGLIAGFMTALVGWIPVRLQVTEFLKWILVNLVGIPAAVVAGYTIIALEPSRMGWFLGGVCAGVIAGGFRSLLLEAQADRFGALLTGSVSWATALTIGSLLVNPQSEMLWLLNLSVFLPVLLLGWIAAGVLFALLMVGLSPLPRPGYPRGRVRWLP